MHEKEGNKENKGVLWYCKSEKGVFFEEVEKELADHLKKLAEQFHGISPKKCVNCHLNGQTETGERKA